MRLRELETGVRAWSFSNSKHVQEACSDVDRELKRRFENKDRFGMPKGLGKQGSGPDAPLTTDYRPELDMSKELEVNDAAYHQSLIGILRWIVELGRVDITTEVSVMSSCLALPREGHLLQLFRMFQYLNKHHNTELVFDPSLPDIDEDDFPKQDWTGTPYNKGEGKGLKEPLPPNRPEEYEAANMSEDSAIN